MPVVAHDAPVTRTAILVRVTIFWAGYLLILRLAALPQAMVPEAFRQLLWGALATLALVLVTWYLTRGERRASTGAGAVRFRSIGHFLGGLLIGTANYTLVILAVSILVSPIDLVRVPRPSAAALLLTCVTVLLLATMEELGFRGYPLRTLLPVLGRWQAQLVVALAFALCHILFGWSWPQVLLGVLPSALLFGAAAERSGGVAMPIGVHTAVNLARTATGETSTPGLWTIAVDDAAAVRLGAWAPGIGCVVTLLVAVAVWRLHLRSSAAASGHTASP